MSIELTAEVIYDGARRVNVQATAMAVDDAAPDNLSLATLVDVSTLSPPAEKVRVQAISGGVEYGVVELYWAALSPVRFAVLSGNALNFDYTKDGCINPPDESTGDILISTVGFASTSTFMLKIGMIKRFS